MKKIVLAMLLVASLTAVAQTASAPASQSASAPVIKDPAEYNAYVGAVQQTDPAAKISGLEAFLTQYPNSVMKEDALEILMGAYQQTGNQAKTIETAQKVLQANPCNLRALALLAYTTQAQAVAGQNAAQNFPLAGQYGEKGIQCVATATKPAGTPEANWDKLKTETSTIFNGAAGLSAYQAKDYAKAEKYLRAAVDADRRISSMSTTSPSPISPLVLPKTMSMDSSSSRALPTSLRERAKIRSQSSAKAATSSITAPTKAGATCSPPPPPKAFPPRVLPSRNTCRPL